MRLWHTTVHDNLPSINGRGLLVSKSQGKMRAVWLHTQAQRTWAFLHVVKRHGGRVENVVSIEVDVPDELVKSSAAPGLYYVKCDIPPEQFLSVAEFRTVAASPLSGRKAKERG